MNHGPESKDDQDLKKKQAEISEKVTQKGLDNLRKAAEDYAKKKENERKRGQ